MNIIPQEIDITDMICSSASGVMPGSMPSPGAPAQKASGAISPELANALKQTPRPGSSKIPKIKGLPSDKTTTDKALKSAYDDYQKEKNRDIDEIKAMQFLKEILTLKELRRKGETTDCKKAREYFFGALGLDQSAIEKSWWGAGEFYPCSNYPMELVGLMPNMVAIGATHIPGHDQQHVNWDQMGSQLAVSFSAPVISSILQLFFINLQVLMRQGVSTRFAGAPKLDEATQRAQATREQAALLGVSLHEHAKANWENMSEPERRKHLNAMEEILKQLRDAEGYLDDRIAVNKINYEGKKLEGTGRAAKQLVYSLGNALLAFAMKNPQAAYESQIGAVFLVAAYQQFAGPADEIACQYATLDAHMLAAACEGAIKPESANKTPAELTSADIDAAKLRNLLRNMWRGPIEAKINSVKTLFNQDLLNVRRKIAENGGLSLSKQIRLITLEAKEKNSKLTPDEMGRMTHLADSWKAHAIRVMPDRFNSLHSKIEQLEGKITNKGSLSARGAKELARLKTQYSTTKLVAMAFLSPEERTQLSDLENRKKSALDDGEIKELEELREEKSKLDTAAAGTKTPSELEAQKTTKPNTLHNFEQYEKVVLDDLKNLENGNWPGISAERQDTLRLAIGPNEKLLALRLAWNTMRELSDIVPQVTQRLSKAFQGIIGGSTISYIAGNALKILTTGGQPVPLWGRILTYTVPPLFSIAMELFSGAAVNRKIADRVDLRNRCSTESLTKWQMAALGVQQTVRNIFVHFQALPEYVEANSTRATLHQTISDIVNKKYEMGALPLRPVPGQAPQIALTIT